MSQIIVIGGGISGLFTAYELAASGADVAVIDTNTDESQTCGLLSAFNTLPLAHEGVISSSFMGLFSSPCELSIIPNVSESFRTWMAKFSLSISSERIKKSQILFEKFGKKSLETYNKLAQKYPEISVKTDGHLLVFSDEQSFKKHLECTKIADKTQEVLDITNAKENLGLISQNIKGIINLKRNGQLNTHELITALKMELNGYGIEFINDEIVSFKTNGANIKKAIGRNGEYEANTFILATGINTDLATSLGTKLNQIPAKFYTIDIKLDTRQIPAKPVVLKDKFIKIEPTNDGIRIISNLQIGTINTLVQMDKINTYLNTLKPFCETSVLREPRYMANFIAITPNDMPLIGRDKTYKNLVFSMGHGWLGLSFAPACARILSELVMQDLTNAEVDELLLFSGFYQG
ncbi:FAD-binding oxidoreductase [Campylobacter sp. faydin G-140]|uniref:NAD(P)/FAD-dependent oxidoreductase n=1 Tax=Campylobacter anatolicus TaxID=2829105 RepID=UPI001B9AB454|nr:FAD-dependent oxidoreductase [Campylobacter anatolicus]MBR8465469.1 FAD-binding oxidoreductase [Campylobacter anatolicus]